MRRHPLVALKGRRCRPAALAACTSGMAVVELGLLMPVLVLLLCGLWDYGRSLSVQGTLAVAAEAGALFGAESATNAANTAGITAAAQTAAGDLGPSVAVSSARTCQCPNGTAVSCTGSCSGQLPSMQVTVTASTPFEPMFPYPLVGSEVTLAATVRMRAQ